MMPVFVGGSAAIDGSTLVAILDYSYFSAGENRKYLKNLLKENRIMDLTGEGTPKSLIVTDKLAYISPISPLALKGRRDRLWEEIYK